MKTIDISSRTAERLRRQTLTGEISDIQKMSNGRYRVRVSDKTYRRLEALRGDATFSQLINSLCDHAEGRKPS